MIKEEVEMLKEESNGIKAELPNLEEELKILLIYKIMITKHCRNKSSSRW